ncbi:hypothetical protein QQF64_018314 [Cirrhinus molitorella]|uniref:Uncharacterized protein n=1 Tax=Cirrhinus molitorella TaxID=172907 RepID=A0ABR3LG68_9TELE
MAMFMKPGEDIKDIDNGIKNKWSWAWIEDVGSNGKLFGNWCQKLRQPGACYCTVCARKLMYGTSGKKVLSRCELDPVHKATVRALQHTSSLPEATAMADIPPSMADRVTDLKIRLCSFIAELDLSFTIAHPLVILSASSVFNSSLSLYFPLYSTVNPENESATVEMQPLNR